MLKKRSAGLLCFHLCRHYLPFQSLELSRPPFYLHLPLVKVNPRSRLFVVSVHKNEMYDSEFNSLPSCVSLCAAAL